MCVLLLDCQLIYLDHGAERIQGMLWWRQSWTPFHLMMDSLCCYEVWPECEIANICCPLTIALSQGFHLCSYLDGFYLFTFPYLSTWADRMDITAIVEQDPSNPWEQFRASKNRHHRRHLFTHWASKFHDLGMIMLGVVMLMQNSIGCLLIDSISLRGLLLWLSRSEKLLGASCFHTRCSKHFLV